MAAEYVERGARRRALTLEELASRRFDLLVIGAGILGSRVAYDAARAGLHVALVDAGDFAGATSSASSKLLHGGLRYLFSGRIGLVRRAHAERRLLRDEIAPHLVRDLPLVLAIPKEQRLAAPVVAAGVGVYAALGGRGDRARGRVSRDSALAFVPPLAVDRLASCALMTESQTHDARLTLATIRGAAHRGAVVANHVRVLELEQARGRIGGAVVRARNDEGTFTVRCRAAVNASGPWVDRIRRLEASACAPVARLSKGTHLVLPAVPDWRAGVAVYLGGHRVAFALPWHDMLLAGVTDTAYEGEPGAARPTPADADQLLSALSSILPADVVSEGHVRSAFCGLRVLPRGNEDTLRAPREHVLAVGPRGLVSVAGGKLTMHRRIALDALARLPVDVRPRGVGPDRERLPGSNAPLDAAAVDRRTDGATAAHLLALYGCDAMRLVSYADAIPDALEPIARGAPDVWAQVYHAVAEEWAVTPSDVLHGRTTLGIRGLARADFASAVSARLGGGRATTT